MYLQGSNRDVDMDNRLMDMSGREEEECETNGDNSMEPYTLSYKIDSQWKFAV